MITTHRRESAEAATHSFASRFGRSALEIHRGDMRIASRTYDRLGSRERLPGWARIPSIVRLYEHGMAPCERHEAMVVGVERLSLRSLRALIDANPKIDGQWRLGRMGRGARHDWDLEDPVQMAGDVVWLQCLKCGARTPQPAFSGGSPGVYYVATNGNDGDVGNETAPWQTLAKARSALVVAGDVVYFYGPESRGSGIWTEAGANFSNSGTSWGNLISWSRYQTNTVIIKPTSGTPWHQIGSSQRYTSITGLIFDGSLLSSTGVVLDWTGVQDFAQQLHHLRFTACTARNCGGDGITQNSWTADCEHIDWDVTQVALGDPTGHTHGIYLLTSNNHLIDGGTWASGRSGRGIHIYADKPALGPNAQITNLTVRYVRCVNNGDGAVFGDCSSGGLCYNSFFYLNNVATGNQGGVAIYSGSIGFKLLNCLAFGNNATSLAGVDVAPGASGTLIANTASWGNGGGRDFIHSENVTQQTNHMSGADPMWVDPQNGDFHLQATSPLREAGTVLSEFSDDADHITRGAVWDIGPHQYAPSSAFQRIARVGPNVTYYTDTGLVPSKQYLYRVRAFNSYGVSSYSNVVPVTTLAEGAGTGGGGGTMSPSKYKALFDSILANEGGYPDAMSLSNWGMEYYYFGMYINGMVGMYRATRDAAYIARALSWAENMISVSIVDNTGYRAWQGEWTGNPYYGSGLAYLLHEVRGTSTWPKLVWAIFSDTALAATYGNRADVVLDYWKRNIYDKWFIDRGYWPSPQTSLLHDPSINDGNSNVHWSDKLYLFGHGMIFYNVLRPNATMSSYIATMLNNIRDRLNQTGAVAGVLGRSRWMPGNPEFHPPYDQGGYEPQYGPANAQVDQPDTSHYSHVPSFVHDAYRYCGRAEVPLTYIHALSYNLYDICWNHSTSDPRITLYCDGSNSYYRNRGPWNTNISSGWAAATYYVPEAQIVGDAMCDVYQTRGPINPTLAYGFGSTMGKIGTIGSVAESAAP